MLHRFASSAPKIVVVAVIRIAKQKFKNSDAVNIAPRRLSSFEALYLINPFFIKPIRATSNIEVTVTNNVHPPKSSLLSVLTSK